MNMWNPSSSIATIVKAIHDDFVSAPPIPLSVIGGSISEEQRPPRPQYVPETFSLSRVELRDLKAQIK